MRCGSVTARVSGCLSEGAGSNGTSDGVSCKEPFQSTPSFQRLRNLGPAALIGVGG